MHEINNNRGIDWGRFFDQLSPKDQGDVQDAAMLHKLATSPEPFLPGGGVLVTRADIVRFLEDTAAKSDGKKPHQVPTAPVEPEPVPQRRDLPAVPASHWRAGEFADWMLKNYPENHTSIFKAENEVQKPAGELQEILRYRGSILDMPDISLVVDKNDPTKFWFKKEEFWTGDVNYYGDGQKPYDASILPWELRF
jgi:hypothetical protein